ncbi:MAG: Fe-S cluster protein [Clostridia bacterium]|nr:Fe-S cluster protein [Clostridia bacterium]
MFLERITITYVEPCWADANKIRLKADFSRDIGELFPYLNAVLPNATYNPHAATLTIVKEGRLIVLYPQRLTMAKARNTTDARQVLDWLKERINQTWERRDRIEPCYETRSRPTALELYQWLPRTNCRQCGEATCLAFAAKLLLGEQALDRCLPLFERDHRHLREAMEELVAALGTSPA